MLLQVLTQTSNTEWLFNSSVILLLALGSLISFFVWAWWLTKREKKPFGEVLSLMAVHQNESIFVTVIIIIFFAEGVLAASVHAPGEIATPPLPRFLAHIAISIVGTVSSVTLIRDIASVFEPKIDWLSRFARVGVMLIVILLTVFVPIGNATLIAAGLGEDLKFYLFYKDYVDPFTSAEEFVQIVRFYGGTANYQSWTAMSYVLKSTVFLTGCHMSMALLEGLRNLASQERRSILFNKKPADKKEEEDAKKREERKKRDGQFVPEKGEERAEQKAEANIKKLLRRRRYDGDILEKHTNAAYKTLQEITSVERRIQFASRIAQIVNQMDGLDANKNLDDAERKRQNEKIREKIYNLFKGSPKAAKVEDMGFGITLKGKDQKGGDDEGED